jgi:hypothetical protein
MPPSLQSYDGRDCSSAWKRRPAIEGGGDRRASLLGAGTWTKRSGLASCSPGRARRQRAARVGACLNLVGRTSYGAPPEYAGSGSGFAPAVPWRRAGDRRALRAFSRRGDDRNPTGGTAQPVCRAKSRRSVGNATDNARLDRYRLARSRSTHRMANFELRTTGVPSPHDWEASESSGTAEPAARVLSAQRRRRSSSEAACERSHLGRWRTCLGR